MKKENPLTTPKWPIVQKAQRELIGKMVIHLIANGLTYERLIPDIEKKLKRLEFLEKENKILLAKLALK